MLMKAGHGHVGAQFHCSLGGFEIAEDQLEKCGLAGPVRAYQRYVLTALHGDR